MVQKEVRDYLDRLTKGFPVMMEYMTIDIPSEYGRVQNEFLSEFNIEYPVILSPSLMRKLFKRNLRMTDKRYRLTMLLHSLSQLTSGKENFSIEFDMNVTTSVILRDGKRDIVNTRIPLLAGTVRPRGSRTEYILVSLSNEQTD